MADAFGCIAETDIIAATRVETWEGAQTLLASLDGENVKYAMFQTDQGHFVECHGKEDLMCVEVRLTLPDGKFQHLVCGRGQKTGKTVKIGVSRRKITADETQCLTVDDAEKILFRVVTANGGIPDDYFLEDVTKKRYG